jgi:hypothetical protein
MPAARDKKAYGLFGEKRDATFHLRVFHFVSDHAVFPVATNAIKSKDIDILITDWTDLDDIKKNYELRKNDRLKKYEIIVSEIDVDIYLPHYSQMIIPCDQLTSMNITKEGFQVLKPEPLLILKQQALLDRKDIIKGQKDRIDILALLSNKTIDFKEYKRLAEHYKIPYFTDDLKKTIRVAKEEFSYLNITNLREIKKLKEEWTQLLMKK